MNELDTLAAMRRWKVTVRRATGWGTGDIEKGSVRRMHAW